MLIYNVTTKVNHTIQQQWLQWMQAEHIPEVVGTGCFTHACLLHLSEADDEEGVTYAVQYHAESEVEYNLYLEKFAKALRQKTIDKWGNRFIAFRTLMQVVADNLK